MICFWHNSMLQSRCWTHDILVEPSKVFLTPNDMRNPTPRLNWWESDYNLDTLSTLIRWAESKELSVPRCPQVSPDISNGSACGILVTYTMTESQVISGCLVTSYNLLAILALPKIRWWSRRGKKKGVQRQPNKKDSKGCYPFTPTSKPRSMHHDRMIHDNLQPSRFFFFRPLPCLFSPTRPKCFPYQFRIQ